MKRDLDSLAGRTFDLLVVGAGIHGAWAAWDAALRGLSVALVDRDDFGAGASANSLRVIHGGLRYLQTADFTRMRESIRERSILLRLAPGLVKPLPFVVATHGFGKRGRAAMGAALRLTDWIGFDRNTGLAAERRIPGGRIVSREECARLVPDLPLDGADGGALWYDGQALDSERLTLACVRSAAGAGAVVANHVAVTGLSMSGERVTGAAAVDALTGRELNIAARVSLLAAPGGIVRAPRALMERQPVALAMNLVTPKRLGGPAAFGVLSRPVRPDPGGTGARYLFFVPWRDSTLIGTFYRLTNPAEAEARPTRSDLDELQAECRRALPSFELGESGVRLVHRGILPLADDHAGGEAGHRLSDRPVVAPPGDAPATGCIRMVGVKYTTARAVAARAVDLALTMLGRRAACATGVTALDHGSGAGGGAPIAAGAAATRADVLRAVREEMAMRLADVVMRRTPLGVEGCPPRASLEAVADIMGSELGWDAARRAAEIDAVRAGYQPVGADAEAVSSGPRTADARRVADG